MLSQMEKECRLSYAGIKCQYQQDKNCRYSFNCSMRIEDDETEVKKKYVRKERWYEKYYQYKLRRCKIK